MDHLHSAPAHTPDATRLTMSPIETDRIRALAMRAVEGAPALTPGEVRELAGAIITHNDVFAR